MNSKIAATNKLRHKITLFHVEKDKIVHSYTPGACRCTDTSDLRHFGPNTFRHHAFGAEVSHIFALAEVSNGHFKCPLDTSAPVPKCLGQFSTKVHETLRTQN